MLPSPLRPVPDCAPWTILPVQCPKELEDFAKYPRPSLRISPSSLAMQSLSRNAKAAVSTKLPRSDAPVEIQILDTNPLTLSSIFVTLNMEDVRKLDEVQAKFGGGFGVLPRGSADDRQRKQMELNQINGNGFRSQGRSQENKWSMAIRNALGAAKVVQTGDVLPLPLPTHPITHVRPPPIKVSASEPVAQGLMSPSTMIITLDSMGQQKTTRAAEVVHPYLAQSGKLLKITVIPRVRDFILPQRRKAAL